MVPEWPDVWTHLDALIPTEAEVLSFVCGARACTLMRSAFDERGRARPRHASGPPLSSRSRPKWKVSSDPVSSTLLQVFSRCRVMPPFGTAWPRPSRKRLTSESRVAEDASGHYQPDAARNSFNVRQCQPTAGPLQEDEAPRKFPPDRCPFGLPVRAGPSVVPSGLHARRYARDFRSSMGTCLTLRSRASRSETCGPWLAPAAAATPREPRRSRDGRLAVAAQ